MAQSDVTQLLLDWNQGKPAALDELLPLVYNELRRLANSYLRREGSDHTLQGTALVHEAWIRMIDRGRVEWQNRAHFFGIAARLMRQILVDHARADRAEKRGGGKTMLALDEGIGVQEARNIEMLALDEALTRLAALDSQQARIVEMRFFGGLSVEETAAVLGVAPITVKRDWAVAKGWLFRELQRTPGET